MQQDSALPRTFLHRTDQLAARMGLNVQDLAAIIGISRRTLFECRSAESAVSGKTLAKLDAAEARARADPALAEFVKPYAKAKDEELGESAHVLRDDVVPYRTRPPEELTVEERLSRVERLLAALAESHDRLASVIRREMR
jgi:DNA-binding Xre family transcriptional regulator